MSNTINITNKDDYVETKTAEDTTVKLSSEFSRFSIGQVTLSPVSSSNFPEKHTPKVPFQDNKFNSPFLARLQSHTPFSQDISQVKRTATQNTPSWVHEAASLTLKNAFDSVSTSSQNRTLIVYPKECLNHETGSHQENSKRLDVLCGPNGSLRRFPSELVEWLESSNECTIRPASLADIIRVHDSEYVFHIQRKCSLLNEKSVVSNKHYSNYLSQSMKKNTPFARFSASKEYLDFVNLSNKLTKYIKLIEIKKDTLLCSKSYEAAVIAAGAVIEAVERVVSNKNRNAFVAIRPPGHHAGSRGCVPPNTFWRHPEMCSCGFCIFNNVAIGAAYARYNFGKANGPIKKIAIVDIDIHHGNGTEEIIKNLSPHCEHLPLPSSWAPIQYTSYKPWLDENDPENIFFCSIHLYNGDHFYPCSGSLAENNFELYPNILNIPLDVVGPPPGDVKARSKLSKSQKAQMTEKCSQQFREKITTELLPRLRNFNANLLLLSTGFDGHSDDYYHSLKEDDYWWITNELMNIMNGNNGKIVSVLEGGYNVEENISNTNTRPQNKKNIIEEVPKFYDYIINGDSGLSRATVAHVSSLVLNNPI